MVDEVVKISTVVTGFISTIAWPIVVIWIVSKFAPLVREFLANMT